MNKALEQNREFFEAAERPSIGLEHITFARTDDRWLVDVEVKNSGRAPAKITDVILQIDLRDAGPDSNQPCPNPPDRRQEAKETLGIPSREIIPINGTKRLLSKVFTNPSVAQLVEREQELFVWTRWEYKGLNENKQYFFEYYGKLNHAHLWFEGCQIRNNAN